jgi:hypothetical protein
VPFQQTARYVTEYGDQVTAAEKKAINKVLPYKKRSTTANWLSERQPLKP